MPRNDKVQTDPFARKIVRTVYFQLIVMLLLGMALFVYIQYSNWREQKITKTHDLTFDEWSRLVRQYGYEEAKKQYEAMRAAQAPAATFPKVFFFGILIIAIYVSVKTRSLTRQYVGNQDVKLKMDVDLALTLLVFLAYVLSFVLIRFRQVSDAAYARWLYGPVVLSAVCVLHYFYRPVRKIFRAIWRFGTKPFRRKVIKIEDLEKERERWRRR